LKLHQLSSTTSNPVLNFSDRERQACARIATTTSFFDIGGDSLLLIQLYRHYQSLFNFDSETLTIRSLFECNTIGEHAKLLETIMSSYMQSRQWYTLHINQGKVFFIDFLNIIRNFLMKLIGVASFAQERIFLDEQVRFSNKFTVYNEVTAARINHDSLSIDRLLQALQFILSKHKILRTSLTFHNDSNISIYHWQTSNIHIDYRIDIQK
jgi:hypothetical protein